jgi:ribosome assembly protein 1
VDPHWKPASEELREEHGEDAELLKNLAKRLANVVRGRKGLPLIGGKVVEDATKQRTRARKV